MEHLDVRDVRGRLTCMLIAAATGLGAALAVTFMLPTRDHFPLPPGSCGFGHWDQGWLVEGGDPVLVLVGAIAIALSCYAVLRWWSRSR